HSGAGVAEGELRGLHGKRVSDPRDPIVAPLHTHARGAEAGERCEHVARMVRVEQVTHGRFTARERGEQQHAVRDALWSRQAGRAGESADGRQIQVVYGSRSSDSRYLPTMPPAFLTPPAACTAG